MKNWFKNYITKGSLKNNFVWSFLGTGVYLGSQWLILLVLAKLGTPIIAGRFAFSLSIAMPIIAICQMQLTQLQITDIRKKHSLKDYFVFRSILLSFGFLIVLVIAFILNFSDFWIIILIFITKCCESLGEIVYGHLQSFEKFKELAYLKVIRGITTISIVLIGTISDIGLINTVALLALGSLMILIFAEFKFVYKTVNNDKFGGLVGLNRIFKTAFPLGLSSGLTSVTNNLPRYFLNFYFGKEVVGFYSVVASPITWIALIPGVMNQVILVRASRYIQFQKVKDYLSIMLKYTILISTFMLIIVSAFYIWGKEMLSILFGAEYAQFSELLKILSLSLLIANIFCIGPYTLSASRSFWFQFFAVFISFITMLIGCFFGLKDQVNWIIVGWIDVARESIGMLYYLTISYFILRKIKFNNNNINTIF